jgi:hypothetical protein
MARGGPRTEGRAGGEPDWLGGSRDGPATAPAEPRQERRKRRPRDDDEAEDEPKGKSKGIKVCAPPRNRLMHRPRVQRPRLTPAPARTRSSARWSFSC